MPKYSSNLLPKGRRFLKEMTSTMYVVQEHNSGDAGRTRTTGPRGTEHSRKNNDLGVPGEPPGTLQEGRNNQNFLFLPHEQDFRLIPFDSVQFRLIPFSSVQFRLKFSRQRPDPDAVHDTTRPTYVGVYSGFSSELSKVGRFSVVWLCKGR